MLFNSYEFIFLFLPITFTVFRLLARQGQNVPVAWLASASLFFYAWWAPGYLVLLLASILINFAAGSFLGRLSGTSRGHWRKCLLTIAIAFNLGLLGYYKYTTFFLSSLNSVFQTHWSLGEIILPLGISFFTFTQITYLVDVYRGVVKEYRLIHYLLFVTYFPHLIAGPILHHGEMMPQFARPSTYRIDYGNLAMGITLFICGLFKKTVFADGIAPYARAVFDAAAAGQTPALLESWCGALAYTLQLYFDFSGYCDMAIGISCLFGVRLPANFFSPYKSVNIIEFWRRWHMTLSRFLRDYLYIPLGGNRRGPSRRYINLLLTMLLGGLWHGANWTFVAWGALHGFYLVINHAWRSFREMLGHDLSRSSGVGRLVSSLLTFLAVVVGWIFFRADSLASAFTLLKGMLGIHGLILPYEWLAKHKLGPLTDLLAKQGIPFVDSPLFQGTEELKWIGALLFICWVMPNTEQIFSRYKPSLGTSLSEAVPGSRWLWHPSPAWAVITAFVGLFAILSLSELSEFIYFQF